MCLGLLELMWLILRNKNLLQKNRRIPLVYISKRENLTILLMDAPVNGMDTHLSWQIPGKSQTNLAQADG